jgi:hypothetical protein
MDSPQTYTWGPHLWMILHSSAERSGLVQYNKLPDEEKRIWLNLLGSLRYSLPCPLCKKHFSTYFSNNRVEINRDSLRTWLYNLHNEINQRNGKINEITIDKIPEIYSKPFNFTGHYNVIIDQMNKALRVNWISREDMQRSVRCFQELKRFYDFF